MSEARAILRAYIDHIRRHAPYGVPETSHYSAMEELFNSVGKTLEPEIFCVVNPSGQGGGIPDGGLFTADQEDAGIDASGFRLKPARGVVEAKPLSEDVYEIANQEQVQRYLDAYGQVLVTNFYQFLLVRRSADGSALPAEFFSLAEDDGAFLSALESAIIDRHAEDLFAFLQLALLSAALITRPVDVANALAFYARAARGRIEEGEVDLSVLETIRKDIENALGITFEHKEGRHFFISTLVQTLFYGVFSAWVLWSETPRGRTPGAVFEWASASQHLHIPVIQALFHRLIDPTNLRALKLQEVLTWATETLNRVDRTLFFEVFDTGQSVQYFYEPFLEAFDPQLRKELGVWYTPPEIVQYMVARVDRVLRDELGIADGLADEGVYVLDPACGTGAYLVAVLEHIYETKKRNYGKAQAASAVRAAVGNVVGEEPAGRIFGFELLPAPFVVAHLQLGLLLQRLEAPLADDTERAGVYLTNALTGWELGKGKDQTFVMQQLRQESGDADAIKQGRKILVVMGNPPYNAFAGTSPQAERIAETEGLLDRYKEGLREKWGIKKYNLDDLYTRFFRIAERCVAEFQGKGMVCYISNFSYLNGDSFTVMREHFLCEFDHIWIDNLNGDSRETGKRTPAGNADPSVFSTDLNKAGIRKGTAICTMVRRPHGQRPDSPTTEYRTFWGTSKRTELIDSLESDNPPEGSESQYAYEVVSPTLENRYCFRPLDISAKYYRWPLVTELCSEPPMNGLMEKRGGALMDIDRKALQDRMEMYYDGNVSWEKLAALETGLTRDAARFYAQQARGKVQSAESYREDHLVRYALRPFDVSWCYYSGVRPLWNEPRPTLWAQVWDGNAFFMSRVSASKDPEGPPFYFTSLLSDDHFLAPDASCFPVMWKPEPKKTKYQDPAQYPDQLEGMAGLVRANLSEKVRSYLAGMGIANPDAGFEMAALIWRHALAVGYSPQYLEDHTDGVQSDWPRIPLPSDAGLLRSSAGLGKQVAALLDIEKKAPNVTSGDIREELRLLGVQRGNDLAITARWGYRDSRGAVMPGPGDARSRAYTPDELAAIEKGAKKLGLELDDALELLGDTTFDLHLNDDTCWANVPANVYGYIIGGYQVIKKWLSYRNEDVIGRVLKNAEAMEVTHMARRIAALVFLQPQLNTNYRAVTAAAYDWPRRE